MRTKLLIIQHTNSPITETNCVGQANNVLCYFSKLSSHVKYRLFHSYCMSLYGSELWLLSSEHINDLRVSWRKCLRWIWGLPPNSHCFLLPLLGRCLPLFDEICRRALNFIKVCICNCSPLVRAVTNYGIQYGRYNSILGHNALFCAQLFDCSVQDIVNGSVERIVQKYVSQSVEDSQLQTASFVRELVFLREQSFELSNSLSLSRSELDYIIQVIST